MELGNNVNIYDAIHEAGCGAYQLDDGHTVIKFPNGRAIAVRQALVLSSDQLESIEKRLTDALMPAAVSIGTLMAGAPSGRHAPRERLTHAESVHARDMDSLRRDQAPRRTVTLGEDDIPDLLPGYEPVGVTYDEAKRHRDERLKHDTPDV